MSKKDKKMSKKDKKMVDPVNEDAVEMVDGETDTKPETKSKHKKGTLVCTRTIRDGGDKYAPGDEYNGKDKTITKRLLERGAIKKA